jgi:hypothetical protein
MKKIVARILIAVGLLACLPFVGLWVLLGMEGYPTPTAVRNFLYREGQIRIELPQGYEITDLKFDGDDLESIKIDGSSAVIRVGYTCAHIELAYAGSQGSGNIVFSEVKKFNNWNRLTFRATPAANQSFAFRIDENGVRRTAAQYAIEQQTTEQAGSSNGG